jgi:hypothetical protein
MIIGREPMSRLVPPRSGIVRAMAFALLGLGSAAIPGCESPAGIAGAVVGTTALGAQAPTHEIEQIYYLGAFDPQEQVPSSVYRIRVHGQASFMSRVKFASGWVKAELIDSLNSRVAFDKEGETTKVERGEGESLEAIQTGRRLILFGPEGFRKVPKDHRLVIVMGTNPEDFFKAIDTALGQAAVVEGEQLDEKTGQEIFAEILRVQGEAIRLADLRADIGNQP